ncbi:hypothetical protein [Desulfurivibrio sp. C05AmB]|jgi:hypothetical protein|uniref:hypothetical protein n=1 Tax=Desulfurivibrio sp. C05AmB TaxID=3374371 RepID=UPI00376F12AA
MKISDWLDQQEAAKVDVSQIELPRDLAFEQDPDETIYFQEIKPCSMVCKKNHPFATVERFDHWYRARGQDKKAGIHSSKMRWQLFTRNKDLALKTAKARIE